MEEKEGKEVEAKKKEDEGKIEIKIFCRWILYGDLISVNLQFLWCKI